MVFGRIDQRFYVPDGCNRAGDYTRLQKQADAVSAGKSDDLKERGEL
jgi:hypothetical protein